LYQCTHAEPSGLYKTECVREGSPFRNGATAYPRRPGRHPLELAVVEVVNAVAAKQGATAHYVAEGKRRQCGGGGSHTQSLWLRS